MPQTTKCTCQHCGNTFVIKISDYNRGRGKYCSQACYNAYRKATTGTNKHPGWVGVECICQTCGKTYFIKQSEFKKGYGKHCSMECRRKPKTKLTCKLCGRPFWRLNCQLTRGNDGQFCSRSCRQKYTCMTKFTESPTGIERLLIDELDSRCIHYEFQYPILNWVIDFAFPEHSLAVEADGIYWHNLDNVQEKDARKDQSLHDKGWTILRFTGDEIRASVSDCVDKILLHLT